MKRTVLYYPTISVPDGAWLRQALFYFDEVASIVPQQIYFSGEAGALLVPLSPELELLRAEGAFRPVAPESLFLERGWPAAHQLEDEFRTVLDDAESLRRPAARYVRMHRNKLNASTLEFLHQKGLLKDGQDARQDAEWFLVEEDAALLYMSMLAQSLADIDPQATVPGTDRPDHESRIYRERSAEKGFAAVETHLKAVIPVPRSDVALSEILEFRRRREGELLRYRAQIDELLGQLALTESRAEIKETVVRFEETERGQIHDLVAVLEEARLATTWGSMKTLTKASSPTFWGSVGVAAGLAAGVASLPVVFAVAGLVVSGTVEVGSFLVDRRNEMRVALRDAPFAYLHYARAKGIV